MLNILCSTQYSQICLHVYRTALSLLKIQRICRVKWFARYLMAIDSRVYKNANTKKLTKLFI